MPSSSTIVTQIKSMLNDPSLDAFNTLQIQMALAAMTADRAIESSGQNNQTQYAEGSQVAAPMGSVYMWKDSDNTLRVVSAAKPLPVQMVFPTSANAALPIRLSDGTNFYNLMGGYDSALPSNGVPIGVSDGGNLVSPRAFDLNTGAGKEMVLGVSLRGSANGSSIEIGTASNPIAVVPGTSVVFPVSQSGTWNVTNITGTISLPTNAATESTQAAINNKLGTLGQKTMSGSAPVVIASDQSPLTITPNGGSVFSVAQSGAWNVTNITGTISLPNGAATSAKQDTGNTSLANIDTKTPGLGAAAAAASTPVTLANDGVFVNLVGATTQTPATSPTNTSPLAGVLRGFWQALIALLPTALSAAGNFKTAIAESLPAGSNAIGSVSISSGTLTANLGTIAGIALDTTLSTLSAKFSSLGQKVMASSTPVVIASDQSTLPVAQPQGATEYTKIGSSAGEVIKSAAGKVYAIACMNTGTATRYLQLFNSTGVPSGTPFKVYPVYANSGLLVLDQSFLGANGLSFSTGICWGFSTTANTYTAGTAAECFIEVKYT